MSYRGRMTWASLVVAGLVGATGCLSELATCADGQSCPTGQVCDDAHASCVLPEQFAVCDGLADGTTCAFAGTAGTCDRGVCVWCGDGIVDPAEVCDDSNSAGGDGCSANCKSDETCG